MTAPATDRTEQLVDLLRQLTDVAAPPGHEGELGEMVASRWGEPGAGRDRLGNRWRTFGEGGDHVLVLAHLDEVALVVRKVEADGFLRVHRVGGVPERNLMGQGVVVLGRDGPVDGVLGTLAHHYASEGQKARVVPADEQYVDVGASTREDARQRLGVDVGDFVVYRRSFRRQGDTVFANAVDDRAGLSVLGVLADGMAHEPPARRVSVLASVQEEFNLRGLLPAVRALRPDLVISLDISPACDTPDLAWRSDVGLGSGPVLHHYSFHGRGTLAGVIPPRWLTDAVSALADAEGVPYQRAAMLGGLTDAAFAQLEGAGAPALEVGIPCRYTHAPVEACHVGDLAATTRLIELAIERLPDMANS